MRLQQGDIIGEKYEIKKRIGAGSFGEIYLGTTLSKLIF